MKTKPTFDEYIASCEEFAQPILTYLRALVHRNCPAIEEKIKWNFPCFVYKGSNLVCMAGFKQHATFGFGLADHMSDHQKVFVKGEKTGMGNFGKLESIKDLPPEEILVEYLQGAMQLHDQGVKQVVRKSTPTKKLPIHPDFKEALTKDNLTKQFEAFSPSQQNEYNEWVNDAKSETTRNKRIVQGVEWISEGKPKNWKYMKSWKRKKV